MAWVQLTSDGQEVLGKAKTAAGSAATAIAGQGKDALRQMVPWREPGAAPTGVPSAPNPAATPPREMPLNIPGNDGQVSLAARNLLNTPPQQQPANAPLVAPAASHAPVSFFGKTGSISLNENSQSNSLARTAAPLSPQPATQPLKATLPGGIAYEGDLRGNRSYTMGTPGQDGYGRMSVRPGTGVAPAVNALATGAGQQSLNIGGLTVSGPHGAVERLSAPVGKVDYNSPQYQQFAAQNRAKEAYVNRDAVTALASNVPQPPKYMTKEEGIAAGMGWKARAGKYREDMDAYNRLTGNQTALDVEGMREAGAGRRALLQAQGVNDQNDLAQQRLTGELGFNQARIGTELLNQQKGQMEIDQAKKLQALNDQYLAEQDPAKQKALGNQLLTMQGKSTKDWQITTREEPLDPANPMLGTTKRPYAVNLNDPNQIIELGGGGGGKQVTTAPQEALDYLKKNPGQSQFFKQKYGYLPDGF